MTDGSTIDFGSELTASATAAATWRNMSLDAYVCEVFATAARMDAELAAFVQEGIDSADRGESMSQEEVEAWFEAKHRPVAAE